jgi:transcriptional regulator with XRE-family HTH domain
VIVMTETKPNLALRAVRESMRMSQDDFANAIQLAGIRAGQPNAASKRLVQRWEAGDIIMPRPVYVRALEMATGRSLEQLGFPAGSDAFVVDDGRGGHDLEVRAGAYNPLAGAPRPVHGNYSGVWLSRYEYWSSSREAMFASLHHVLVLQHSDQLTVRSLPNSADSLVTMALSVDGNVVTGTWTENTSAEGFYRGAIYHGALQMQADATGRRMTGKWVGFGKSGETNTGPWSLEFRDASTSKAAVDRYDRPPEG